MPVRSFPPFGLLLLVTAGIGLIGEGSLVAAAPSESETKTEKSAFTPPELFIGDAAPKLQLGEWLKGDKVEALADDKIYVLEFWATWCGPCIASMPHITELQEKYKDSITIIGVNVKEQPGTDVAAWVEKKGEVMGYRVVRDDVSEHKKGAMAATWLKPAQQAGIPCSFVVQRGKIAWIGHPMALDKVLPEVIDGKFDIAKARTETLAALELEAKITAVQNDLAERVREKDMPGVNAALEKLAELNPAGAAGLEAIRFKAYLKMKDYAAAYGLKEALFEKYQRDVAALYEIAMAILTEPGLKERDFDMAVKFAAQACENTRHKHPLALDALARAYFEKGDFEKAVETETAAVENGGRLKGNYERTLKKYQTKLDAVTKAAEAKDEEKSDK